MTANAANRVKDAVQRLNDVVNKAADDVANELNQASEQALDKFNTVKVSVTKPLKDALAELDDVIGLGSNQPPKE